ncbi:hypothetical protein ACJIZ3_014687 [Penstemon smallii]|uniref:tRNA/rRNA methyltransferase SpoU type domain-containing protein n=1 Tax=Penstemon smallii TaxID=265156 RepID=A0ABD3RL18_9LAMI
MIPCKTLIRTSFSCLEFPPKLTVTTLRHFTSSLPPHPGLKLKTQEPFPTSRSFCCAKGAIPLESVTLETPLDSLSKDNVEELLVSKDKDDISRLMKMERYPESDGELKDNRKRERWFPYLDKFKAEDVCLSSGEVLEAMEPYIMDVRKEKFRNAVNNRSYSVCLVVEGLSDCGNVSAAFRSADALGFQSVHVVSYDSSKSISSPPCRFRDNRHVSMGAEKWLDIELWDSTKECFGILKSRGYRIATTHLGADAVSVYDMDWSCPTAIVLGNELRGISAEALELSDLHCSIPMRGMVDSFNVSVAAGLLMHQAVRDRTFRMGCHGDLTQEERQILLAEFYLRHSNTAMRIANEYSKKKLATHVSKL